MLKNFFITQEDVDTLTQGITAKSLWNEEKYKEWNDSLEKKLEQYIENLSGKESLKADEIYNLFYPEKDIPIFISHSSTNKDVAQKLALWLKDKLGLYSFIDSDLWGNINVIQKKLDKKYCPKGKNVFDYDKRNMCTAHVHMILSYALTRMIDKADFFIFIKSNGSISLEGSVERTSSSWIFHELVTASLIEKKARFDILDTNVKKAIVEACTGKIPISYPVPLDGFNTLNSQTLKSIAQTYSDLKLDPSSHEFGKYSQNTAYWTAICADKGIPSNETIAKNCLLGYKRKDVDERLASVFSNG